MNNFTWAFPVAQMAKKSAYNAGDLGSIPGSGRPPGEENGKPTPVFFPEESHGQKSLVGYSPWGHSQTRLSDEHFTWLRVIAGT